MRMTLGPCASNRTDVVSSNSPVRLISAFWDDYTPMVKGSRPDGKRFLINTPTEASQQTARSGSPLNLQVGIGPSQSAPWWATTAPVQGALFVNIGNPAASPA